MDRISQFPINRELCWRRIDDDDDNDADSNQHEPNEPDPDQIHNLMIPEMTKSQETDSFNYSLSLSEYDDDGNHGTNEPQPARDRSGTLKRQRARLDLLSVVIFDEVEDRDGDEHHPQCPDIHDDSNSNEGGKGNWYQRVSTLYNLPSTKQDDEPNAHFSISLLLMGMWYFCLNWNNQFHTMHPS